MKASDLKEKSVEELTELLKTNRSELFQARLQNYTNQLDDTASLPKHRKDAARIQGELRRRELDALAQSVKAALEAQTAGKK
jgi:large subunit ribosomal protein L29